MRTEKARLGIIKSKKNFSIRRTDREERGRNTKAATQR